MTDLDILLKNDPIYKKIEEFISQLEEKNIQLNSKAQTMEITENKGKDIWGKKVKETQSLPNKIADLISQYQQICNSERVTEILVDKSQSLIHSNGVEGTKEFIFYLDTRSALRSRKAEVANYLYTYIKLAYCNNLIDDIGLGNKLKTLENENANQKRLIESLEKLSKEQKKELDALHKRLPNFQTGRTEIGDLTR